jgi:hypothetical protein
MYRQGWKKAMLNQTLSIAYLKTLPSVVAALQTLATTQSTVGMRHAVATDLEAIYQAKTAENATGVRPEMGATPEASDWGSSAPHRPSYFMAETGDGRRRTLLRPDFTSADTDEHP